MSWSRFRRALPRTFGWMAAGAVLALASCGQPARPFAKPGGTEIVTYVPAPGVRRVTEFRWASPVESSRYILVVRNGGTAEVLRRETADQQFDIGPDLAGRFPPGIYNWTVEALDREGRTIATSKVQTFEVR
jgi:hypothetical protein